MGRKNMAEIMLKDLKAAVYYLVYAFKQGQGRKKKVNVQYVEWRQPACGMQQDRLNA